ncbi:hypothetical protein ACTXT7_007207 [Hymenolepis weldensis]
MVAYVKDFAQFSTSAGWIFINGNLQLLRIDIFEHPALGSSLVFQAEIYAGRNTLGVNFLLRLALKVLEYRSYLMSYKQKVGVHIGIVEALKPRHSDGILTLSILFGMHEKLVLSIYSNEHYSTVYLNDIVPNVELYAKNCLDREQFSHVTVPEGYKEINIRRGSGGEGTDDCEKAGEGTPSQLLLNLNNSHLKVTTSQSKRGVCVGARDNRMRAYQCTHTYSRVSPPSQRHDALLLTLDRGVAIELKIGLTDIDVLSLFDFAPLKTDAILEN